MVAIGRIGFLTLSASISISDCLIKLKSVHLICIISFLLTQSFQHSYSHSNIARRKVVSNKLTAGMFTSRFNEKIRDFISSDRTFTFIDINGIRKTQHIRKSFYLMSCPRLNSLESKFFFITLPFADLRWNELISIIIKLHKQNLSKIVSS